MRPSGMLPALPRLAVVLVVLLGTVAGAGGTRRAAAAVSDVSAPGLYAASAAGDPKAVDVPRAAAVGRNVTFTVGFGGVGLPGAAIPVRVRIAADRLLVGTAEVTVGPTGGRTSARVSGPVEVAGGSVKEYLLVAPTPTVAPLEVSVRVTDRGALLASERVTVEAPRDEELVGLLPGVLAGAGPPGPAPLAVDAGVARFFVLDDLLMARAPQSLESLGVVGMPADGLRTLAPAARTALLRWVADGGRLMVDTPPRAPGVPGDVVWGLPDEWQPGDTGRRDVGRGEVVAAGGSLAAGRWPGLVEPTTRGSFADSFLSPADMVSSSLAQDAGLASRGQAWLTGILVLYVVVVGPLLFLVLRRRRREELTWVAVPVVAVLFATGSYVQGRQLRAAGDAHASVIVSAPSTPGAGSAGSAGGAGSAGSAGSAGGATAAEGAGESAGLKAVSYVGLVADRTGTTRLRFPPGWSVRLSGNGMGVMDGGTIGVATTRAGQEAELSLNSGQAGVVAGSGPVAGLGGDSANGSGLTVTAVVKDGRLTGVVRNATQLRMEAVAVVVGTGAVGVGALGPGEERTWTMSGEAPLPTGDPLVPALMSMLGSGSPESSRSAGSPGSPEGVLGAYGLWQAVQATVGRDLPAPGEATAVGWTRDWRPSFVVNGRTERPPGRTMVLGTGAVSYQSGRLPLLAVAREEVRGAGTLQGGFGAMPGGGAGAASVVRFRLPTGARPGSLVLRTLTAAQVEIWRDGAWSAVDAATRTPVDDASLPSSGAFFGGLMRPVPMPVPAPPKVGLAPPGADQPGNLPASTLVEYDLGPSEGLGAGGVLFVRVRTADGQTAGGGYTWVRER